MDGRSERTAAKSKMDENNNCKTFSSHCTTLLTLKIILFLWIFSDALTALSFLTVLEKMFNSPKIVNT